MKKNGRAKKSDGIVHETGPAVETIDSAAPPIAAPMEAPPALDEPVDDPRVIDGTAHVGDAETDSLGDDAQFALAPELIIEAVLLSTDVPLPGGKLAQIVGGCNASDVQKHIETLNAKYEQMGCTFRIEAIAKGYQILTLPAYNPWISKLHKARADSRLTPAALETLAVIAYKQPAMRAAIEAVRGVAVGDVLGRLREVNLVKIVGRAEEIGRPLLYGTTTRFLEVFGLASLKDLPRLDPEKPDEIPALKVVEETPDDSMLT